MKDEEIARVLKVGAAPVERVRRRCVEEGLEKALGRDVDYPARDRIVLVMGNLNIHHPAFPPSFPHRKWDCPVTYGTLQDARRLY